MQHTELQHHSHVLVFSQKLPQGSWPEYCWLVSNCLAAGINSDVVCDYALRDERVAGTCTPERPVQALRRLIDTGPSHSVVSQRIVTDNNIAVDASSKAV